MNTQNTPVSCLKMTETDRNAVWDSPWEGPLWGCVAD